MNFIIHHDAFGYTCKWCDTRPFEVFFENARLCRICHEKALLAVQNPQLCKTCSDLAVNEFVSLKLFSEDGYDYKNRVGLEIGSESGCGLCRLFLLQDPNPDQSHLRPSLTLFADGDVSEDGSGRDINSLYFSSFQDMFRLKLAVSAAPGTSPSTLN
jgi:hypothetical protein